jgi:CRP-like cAMP-binding protein
MNIELFGYGVVSGILVYQLFVTIRVARAAEYSRRQRMVQTILIWLFPLLGAALCHTVLYTTTDRSRPTDKKYLEDDPLDGLYVRREGRVRSHHRDADPTQDGGGTGADGGD